MNCTGKTVGDAPMRAIDQNWDSHISEWKTERKARGQDPCQWDGPDGFRQHEIAITFGFDPGDTPTELFCKGCSGLGAGCQKYTGNTAIDNFICFFTVKEPLLGIGAVALLYLLLKGRE